jgi:hypothetical protein
MCIEDYYVMEHLVCGTSPSIESRDQEMVTTVCGQWNILYNEPHTCPVKINVTTSGGMESIGVVEERFAGEIEGRRGARR